MQVYMGKIQGFKQQVVPEITLIQRLLHFYSLPTNKQTSEFLRQIIPITTITYKEWHVLICMHRTAARSDDTGGLLYFLPLPASLVPSEIHVYSLHAPKLEQDQVSAKLLVFCAVRNLANTIVLYA